jgi:hypothetical protein
MAAGRGRLPPTPKTQTDKAIIMTDRIRSILQRLEQTREDLLALSDDIWLSIDHNDPQALEEGVAFKKEYNVKVAAFDQLAGELSALVQRFTAVRLDEAVAPPNQTPQSKERIIRDLDQRQAYGLEEDLTFKRPYGFQLNDAAQAKVNTWRRLYELICLHLERRDPQRSRACRITLPSPPDAATPSSAAIQKPCARRCRSRPASTRKSTCRPTISATRSRSCWMLSASNARRYGFFCARIATLKEEGIEMDCQCLVFERSRWRGNWHMFANTDTRTRKKLLEEIAVEFGVRIQVEIVK